MMIVLYSVLALAAFIIPMILFMKWKNRFGKSEFDDILFLNDKIYLFSNVFHSGGEGDAYTDCRIMEIDPFTGNVTRRLIPKYFSKLKIIGEINGKIWLKDTGFCVFDPVIFDVVLMAKDIGHQLPELEDVNVKEFYLNEPESRVFFLAENGYKYSIDPDTFAIERCTFTQQENVIKKRLKHPNPSEFTLRKSPNNERTHIFYGNKNINTELSFLKPIILRTTITDEPIGVTDPESIVVMHYETLNRLSPFTISLISKEGVILWSITQDMMQVKHEAEYDNEARLEFIEFKSPMLTLVFNAKRDKILCIDVVKGKVVWNLSM